MIIRKGLTMKKTIVLVDITKLHGGKCCVAGVCREEGGRLYRLSSPYVTREFVNEHGWKVGTELSGVFEKEVNAGKIHCEDSFWNAAETGNVCVGGDLKTIFEGSCVESLRNDLGIVGKGTPVNEFVPHGRSIVTVVPQYISRQICSPFNPGGKPSIKLAFTAGGMNLKYIPITDVRFYHDDGSIDENAVAVAQGHIRAFGRDEEELFVRVGITRAYDPKQQNDLKYWTQIDGLHFFKKNTNEYVQAFSLEAPRGSFWTCARFVA